MTAFATDIAGCDVQDKGALLSYRAFREEALLLLKDDPDHSIWHQILELSWEDATYRTLNEARRSPVGEQPLSALAPLLAHFIDAAYAQSQIIAVGRLTDPPNPQPKRGVVSLPTILELIRVNSIVLTREMFVCFDGLPFDYEAVRAARPRDTRPGVRWVARQPEDDSEALHDLFDLLSGTHGARSRFDRIDPTLLQHLEAKLNTPEIGKLRHYRNKVVAHSSTVRSRSGVSLSLGLTFEAFEQIHRDLIEVADMASWICQGSLLLGSPIAIAPFDLLDGLEHPYATTAGLNSMQAFWEEMTTRRQSWSGDALTNVMTALGR